LATQALISNDTGVTSTINAAPNSWYRITNRYTYASAGTYSVRVYLMNPGTNFVGDGVSGLYVWGAQLEFNDCISAYQANLGTITQVLPFAQPASKTTSTGSVLIPGTFDEVTYNTASPVVVNRFAYSEQYNQSGPWFTSRATIAVNQTTAPNGTITADKLIEDLAATAPKEVQQGIDVTAGNTYTVSTFVKAAGRSNFKFGFSTNSFVPAAGTNAIFNLTTATVYQITGGVSAATITDVGNGWYRCTATVTPNVSTIAGQNTLITYITLLDASYSTAYAGDGTSGMFLWGSQIELGSTASIYQGIAAANVLITTGMTQRVTSSGNRYVSSNYDEWAGVPITEGLVLYADAAISSSFVPGATTWYNIANASANGSITTTSAGVANSNEISYDNATMSITINDNSNFSTGQIRFPNIDYNALAASGNFTVMFAAKKDYYGLAGNNTGNSELFQAVSNGYDTGWRLGNDNQGTPGAPFTGIAQWNISMSPAAVPAGFTAFVSDTVANRWSIVAFSISPTTVYGFCNNNISTRSNPGTYYGGVSPVNRGWINFTGAGAGSFNGKLGFFMVYNRALTTAELTYNYTQFARRYGLS
jgi:hypothetical protein